MDHVSVYTSEGQFVTSFGGKDYIVSGLAIDHCGGDLINNRIHLF